MSPWSIHAWGIDGKKICTIDVNECDSNNGGCADVCENHNGSFTCSCSTGYEFEPGDDGDPTNAGRQCRGMYVAYLYSLNKIFILTNAIEGWVGVVSTPLQNMWQRQKSKKKSDKGFTLK